MTGTDASYEEIAVISPDSLRISRRESHPEVVLHRGGPEVIQRHAEAWRELCDRARPEMAFLRPELVKAYFDAYAPNDPVVLLTAYREGELVALLPLHEASAGVGPFRVNWLRSAGNAHFPRFDALYSDEEPDVIAREFLNILRPDMEKRALYLKMAATDGVLARMWKLTANQERVIRIHDTAESPYVAVPSADMSREDVIAAQRSSLRSMLRRGLRRLEDRGTLRAVFVQDEAEGKDLADWLETFCRVEHQGWKGGAGTSIRSNAATSRFYRSLARDAGLRPYFRCLALMLGDEMVAGEIGLFAGGTYFSLKLAINEDYKDCSPGHLVHLYLLMQCARDGGSVLDLLGRAEPYKMAWTETTRPCSNVFIFPKGLRGRMQHAVVFDVVLRGKDYLRTKPAARRIHQLLQRMSLR